jgi:hypothetical protein
MQVAYRNILRGIQIPESFFWCHQGIPALPMGSEITRKDRTDPQNKRENSVEPLFDQFTAEEDAGRVRYFTHRAGIGKDLLHRRH